MNLLYSIKPYIKHIIASVCLVVLFSKAQSIHQYHEQISQQEYAVSQKRLLLNKQYQKKKAIQRLLRAFANDIGFRYEKVESEKSTYLRLKSKDLQKTLMTLLSDLKTSQINIRKLTININNSQIDLEIAKEDNHE